MLFKILPLDIIMGHNKQTIGIFDGYVLCIYHAPHTHTRQMILFRHVCVCVVPGFGVSYAQLIWWWMPRMRFDLSNYFKTKLLCNMMVWCGCCVADCFLIQFYPPSFWSFQSFFYFLLHPSTLYPAIWLMRICEFSLFLGKILKMNKEQILRYISRNTPSK